MAERGDDATKRLGGSEDNRCRVTVTDKFGGGDFQVDKEANANGGMLVIATSIPTSASGSRKGRTARQDRLAVHVLLDESSPPFTGRPR